jgi:hypothetical protein
MNRRKQSERRGPLDLRYLCFLLWNFRLVQRVVRISFGERRIFRGNILRWMKRGLANTAPNGGLAAPVDNSEVVDGPPSLMRMAETKMADIPQERTA